MSYFSRFPVVKYPIIETDKNSRFVVCRNILRRVSMLPQIKDNSSALVSYSVLEGEKPEHLAEKMYGRENDHWLVLLSNDVFNVYNDWHKPQDIMDEYISKKHSGYRVYFTKTDNTILYNSLFHSGATLTQGDYSASVMQYTPNYCSFWIETQGFSSGSATIGVSGEVYSIKIHRVISGPDALHHFEVSKSSTDLVGPDKVLLDPLSVYTTSYMGGGGVVGGKEDPYPVAATDGIGHTGSGVVELWETNIGKYMGISGSPVTVRSISNKAHEITVNEEKRQIQVLTPLYRDQAVKQMESILRD